MSVIQKLYDQYGRHGFEENATRADTKRARMELKNLHAEELVTVDDHRMYLEVLQKLRIMDEENLEDVGKNLSAVLDAALSVGEDGIYKNQNDADAGLRFFYELIQNADDCEFDDISNCCLEIMFNCGAGQIIFTYNEKGFTPENVYSITAIGDDYKIRSQRETIGEKGIGFKSVFGVADRVLIQSGKFSFSLSKGSFIVPEPCYKNFTPRENTRLVLEMSPQDCMVIYRKLEARYKNPENILNENPILFLRKITHLKISLGRTSLAQMEFNVQRKDPEIFGDLQVESDIKISVNIKPIKSSTKMGSEITCYRYTMPVVYGKKACESRYKMNGEEVPVTKRRHTISAVIPVRSEDLKKYQTGNLYSFLPTTIRTSVPITLHVPYKLDLSRGSVDSQGRNEWFTYTNERLSFFLKQVYIHLAGVLKEKILPYIPKQNEPIFQRCFNLSRFTGSLICTQKVFYTIEGKFEDAAHAAAFKKDEVKRREDAERIFSWLGGNFGLFVPITPTDMKPYGCEIIENIHEKLFQRGLENVQILSDILDWIDNSNRGNIYETCIKKCGHIAMSEAMAEIISNHEYVRQAFLTAAVKAIRDGESPDVELLGLTPMSKSEQDYFAEQIKNAMLDQKFMDYMERIQSQIFVINCPNKFVMAGKNGIVLAREKELESLSELIERGHYDSTNTFIPTVKLMQISKNLDQTDESISDDEYLKILIGVRSSIEKILGRQYGNYIESVVKVGRDKNRFLNELLQNADDACYELGIDPAFTLTLNADMMTVSYNEIGFTRKDVRAITAIGDSTKNQLLSGHGEQIGEKGIGFKSVFGVAQSVEIHSNGFNFRLEEQEITVPKVCSPIEKNPGTTMIFHMKEDVRSEFTEERILPLCICLRKLKHLHINGHNIDIADTEGKRCVSVNGKVFEFERYDYSITIDSDAVAERNAPGKRFSKENKVTFYIPVKVGRDSTLQFHLYSGLPLKVKSSVPLIVDAPFELDTSRENIYWSKWSTCVQKHMYGCLLRLIEQKSTDGLDCLRFVAIKNTYGYRNTASAYHFGNNFDDARLNLPGWYKNLRLCKLCSPLAYRNRIKPGPYCVIIPDFLAKVDNIQSFFSGRTIIDTIGKSKYIPLLSELGCVCASEKEIFSVLSHLIPSYMVECDFRAGLYKYLSGTRFREIDREIDNQAGKLPIYPVRTNNGIQYVCWSESIYYSNDKTAVSRDDYYVLDTEILPLETAEKFPGPGNNRRFCELTQEVFDAKYRKELISQIEHPTGSQQELVAYLLKELSTNRSALEKCKDNLAQRSDKIPLLMCDGKYKEGKKFLNTKKLWYVGSLVNSMIVAPEHHELGSFLGLTEIQEIHYEDMTVPSCGIADDDLEDLSNDFTNYFEIMNQLVRAGFVSEKQIRKFHLEFAEGNRRNQKIIEEEFPSQAVLNMVKLRRQIQCLWETRKNPYEQKIITVWEPKYGTDKVAYLNAYSSRRNPGMCFCQMCKKLIDRRYIEQNDIELLPKYEWKQMYINLCVNCSRDFRELRSNNTIRNNFVKCIMEAKADGLEGTVEVPIGTKSIAFTSTHLAEIQEIFKVGGWGDNFPRRPDGRKAGRME